MLINLIAGESVRLDLEYDLEQIVGIFDGISEATGFVKILSAAKDGWESISFVNPNIIKEIHRVLVN
ncbi:MAG: hypothetical protein K0Q73_5207 [Paenibacillus sp.]|jgi:hypothetical protein|nr:hypothetical protein [Paenibacillus sp.]